MGMKKTESELEITAIELHDTIGNPLREASSFYTAYYLSEIEGIKEAEFDLFQMKGKLYDVFGNYVIHSILKEMFNAKTSFYIHGRKLRKAARVEIRDYVDKTFPFGIRKKILRILTIARDERPMIWRDDADSNVETYMTWEESVSAFSEQREFLKAAEAIFNEGGELSKDEIRDQEESGWRRNFGGPSWGKIASHGLMKDELTKISWIDLSWSIQHNTGNWFNKIKMQNREKQLMHRNWDFVSEDKRPPSLHDISDAQARTFLEKILDKNMEGDMEFVFDWASLYDDALDINPRRYKRLL